MTVYFIQTKRKINYCVDEVDLITTIEPVFACIIICDEIEAETRGRARAKFCAEHDLAFTEPLSIRKVVEV